MLSSKKVMFDPPSLSLYPQIKELEAPSLAWAPKKYNTASQEISYYCESICHILATWTFYSSKSCFITFSFLTMTPKMSFLMNHSNLSYEVFEFLRRAKNQKDSSILTL